MVPYEIVLSESQERMLLVVDKGREREVEAVFEKWDLHAVRIGEVTTTGRVRLFEHDVLVADVPARALTDEGPVYRRPMREPSWQRRVQQLDLTEVGSPVDPRAAFAALLAPVIASKRWAFHRIRSHGRHQHHRAPRRLGPGVVRVKEPLARWRCRSTATGSSVTSIRIAGRCWRLLNQLATSRAPAPSRLAPRTT